MTPRLMDRLADLERGAVPLSGGRHLVFRVEGAGGTSTETAVAFLKDRGHAIRDEDSVLVMLIPDADADVPFRDLTPTVLTEAAREQAPSAVAWPPGLTSFTFQLDSAGGR